MNQSNKNDIKSKLLILINKALRFLKKGLSSIWNFVKTCIKMFFKGVIKTFQAVKFIFTIPLLSFAASVFVLLFALVFKPIINALPDSINNGFIESFLAAIIFVLLRFYIFRDKLLYNKNFDHYKSLSGFIFSIIFWVLPVLLFRNEAIFAEAFLATGQAHTPFALIYVAFYLPHMWIGVLFGEFFYVVMGGLVLNSAIAAIATGIITNNFVSDAINN